MRMNEKTRNIIVGLIMGCALIVTLGLIVFNYIYEKSCNIKIENSNIYNLSDGWMMDDGTIISTPLTISYEQGDMFSFSNRLPDNITDKHSLLFRSESQINRVYVDNELIYTFGDHDELPFANAKRNMYLMVPLKQEYGGKTIKIEIQTTMMGLYELNDIYIGNEDALTLYMIKRYMWAIVLCVIYLLIALIAILLACYSISVKIISHGKLLINCAIYNICMFARVVLSTSLVQFITSRQTSTAYLYAAIMSWITSVITTGNGFIFEEKKKIFSILTSINYLVLIGYSVCLILFDFNVVMISTPIFIGVIAYSSILALVHRKDSVIIKVQLFNNIGMIIFFIIGIIELAYNPRRNIGAFLILLGYMVYGIGLIYIIEKKHVEVVDKITQTKIFKEIAQNDALTGLGNRMALQEEVASLKKLKNENAYVTFIMCDLNFLKKTNDELGHDEGDKLIITAAKVLENASNGYGKCFRLGGDEFGILAISKQNIERLLIENILAYIRKNNEGDNKKISIAIGFKTRKNNGSENFFKELYVEADNKMYEDKRRKHEKMALNK